MKIKIYLYKDVINLILSFVPEYKLKANFTKYSCLPLLGKVFNFSREDYYRVFAIKSLLSCVNGNTYWEDSMYKNEIQCIVNKITQKSLLKFPKFFVFDEMLNKIRFEILKSIYIIIEIQ